jgi:hypothetical protein
MGDAVVAEIERAAAVRQPAHDELVAREHLLAVDAQVLPRLVRPARDDQAPGDERRHVAGPAVLHRQARQVDVRLPTPRSWHGAEPATLGAMCHSVLSSPPRPSMSLKPLGAWGSLRLASNSPNVRSSRTSATPMARATRAVVPNRLPSTGMLWPVGCSNSRAGPPARRAPVAQRGHFQNRRHRHGHAPQFASFLQLGHEVAQVAVGHVCFSLPCPARSSAAPASAVGSAGPAGQ